MNIPLKEHPICIKCNKQLNKEKDGYFKVGKKIDRYCKKCFKDSNLQ